jgi:hypothetical protein
MEPNEVLRELDLGLPLNSQYPSAGFIWQRTPF